MRGKEVTKNLAKIAIPATVAALFLTSCGEVHTEKVVIYSAQTPSAATGTPTPRPTETPAPTRITHAPRPMEKPRAATCTPRPTETPKVPTFTPRPTETPTPKPTEVPSNLKAEYGNPIAFNPGETKYVSYGAVISGDVKVNDKKVYDNLAQTGLIIKTRGNLVKIEAPYGASGKINLKGNVEIDAVIQQQVMATFGSHPEINTISVYDAQAGQVTQVFMRQ